MNSKAGICRVCGREVQWRSGLSNRVHAACRAKEAAKKRAKPERSTPAYKLTRSTGAGVTVPNIDIAKGNHRDRKLLDLAHALHVCTACGVYVEAGLEPAHSNMARHGKGKSIKASDVFFAALCPACHHEIDQGSKLSREERQEIWQRAFEKTLLTLFERGLIKVAA